MAELDEGLAKLVLRDGVLEGHGKACTAAKLDAAAKAVWQRQRDDAGEDKH